MTQATIATAHHAAPSGTSPSPSVRSPLARSPLARYPLLRSLALYRKIPVLFTATFALFAVINLSLSLQQWLVGRALDAVNSGKAATRLPDGSIDFSVALHWAALLVALATARGVLQYISGMCSIRASQSLLSTLREKILVQVQSLQLGYHWQHGMGEMITRTTRDADKLRDALVAFWRQTVETALVVGAAMGLLFWYDRVLGLVPFLLTVIGFLIFVRQTDTLVVLDRNVSDAYDQVNQDLSEGIGGVRVIKSFRLEQSRIRKFQGHVGFFLDQSRHALAWCSSRIPIPQAVVALGHVWIMAYGAHLVVAGRLGIGELVSALLIATTLVFRVETIGRVMRIFADARASAARIWDLLDERPSIVGGDVVLPDGPLGFRLNAVRLLSPGGETAVLDDCSLTVEPGQIVALVGATGSGKSSLASLLPRLADASGGAVAIGSDANGWHDVRRLDLAALRRRVHVVPQDIFLFSDTLAANLRAAAPDADDAALEEALSLAGAGELLARLPEGLETRIGDRGVTLSGGQRQRLCLARALLGRPDILVLDDATSALDAVTERAVLTGIRNLRAAHGGRMTVLLVTSKLSSVLQAERALLLAGGRIRASGKHEDLLLDPLYRDLLGIDRAAA
ncbi:ABC transporter ATP-binding protein [uncultured Novosphingobium sp.]|uniref:ABC transporter ATP-binding protein n=1 Tax=uncultured Novosphingobium sp. TaxID=292277 RepID=UPI002592F021|nr:ABC transporter ATP-binding protein [uncultured Novosphingobium sp.]